MTQEASATRDLLVEVLCSRHCAFFKPWKAEEGRCGGYEWFLRRREQRELQRLSELSPLPKSRVELAHDSLLGAAICAGCSFRVADCDFRDPSGPPDAVPCGGLLAVDVLLITGALRVEELVPRETQSAFGTSRPHISD